MNAIVCKGKSVRLTHRLALLTLFLCVFSGVMGQHPFVLTTSGDTTFYKINVYGENEYRNWYMVPQRVRYTSNDEKGNYAQAWNQDHLKARWCFIDAGIDEGVQYYYFINKNQTYLKYLGTDGTASSAIIDALQSVAFDSNNEDRFKFAIVSNDDVDGFYNIIPKLRYGANDGFRYINKKRGSQQNPIQIYNVAGLESSGKSWSLWRFVNPQCQRPTLTYANASVTITAEEGANIRYVIGNGNDPSFDNGTLYDDPIPVTGNMRIRAVAFRPGESLSVSEVEELIITDFRCPKPVMTYDSDANTISLSCSNPAAQIRYVTDGGHANATSPLYNASNPISITGIPFVVSAIAMLAGDDASVSEEARCGFIDAPSQLTDAYMDCVLMDDITLSSGYDMTYTGVFDGNYHSITGLQSPLFTTLDGGIVKNVILKEVNISGSGNMGAIAKMATGTSKIYNCGILDGTVTGGTNTGGLVGRIESGSSVRVVNCYNFADVTGGGGTDTYAAGIVGRNEGTVSYDGTVGNVRIALCMMYGNVTGATNISPVYGGNHVNNVQNFTEYNYWRYRSGMQYTAYNDQMAIDKDDFLTRFPFYTHILNTHREMAAFFLFGGETSASVSSINENQIKEMGHWVLKKDVADYPIIEPWQTNTKKVLDAPAPSNILTEMGGADHPGYLYITVKIGSHTYTESAPGQPYKLPITDMDEANYDYTWGKVVLPFANEFEINTDYSKICTGWKITGITGGTAGTFENYNVSDRNCTTKDLFSTTGFIFAQGGNFIVPYDVTAIEITANFATAYYLSDGSYEIGYNVETGESGYSGRTALGGNTPNTYQGQTVRNTLPAVLQAMTVVSGTEGTPHERAVVLVGNYHMDSDNLSNLTSKGYTIMSIDADNNQEPDYAIYSNNTNNRPPIPPTRFDFVAFIPLGMSSHVTNAKFYPNTPIWKPRGWFEITETGLMFANQFEIQSNNFDTDGDASINYRCIINGGYFTQMVRSFDKACTKLSYYQIGGKAYIKEFYPGNHSDKSYANTLVPINVTGGEIEQCFMTGYGKGTVTGENIFFWCAGGKIHKFLGAYMEKPTTAGVNMTANIDHAVIVRFFGGGTTQNASITGNIVVTIKNSKVDFYCGGPEFGDMVTGENGKTVTTNATNTTFGEYYGAGFGGTAITYRNDKDDGDVTLNATVNYPNYFEDYYIDPNHHKGRLYYLSGSGLGSCYKFEFLMHSRGHRGVARFYTGFASFSLATTGNVTNKLDKCTILESFYGAGCQGKVSGTVTSTLTDCTVQGSAFGGGYKAAANEVDVYPTDVPELSVFKAETGIFSDFGTVEPEKFTWEQGDDDHYNVADDDRKILYTAKENVIKLADLGNVTGDISITLKGNTTVLGNVFGGGNESKSLQNTLVKILEDCKVFGNIYGGGNMAEVGGNTMVIVNGQGVTNDPTPEEPPQP